MGWEFPAGRSVPLTDGVGSVDNSISDSRKDGTYHSRLYYVSTHPAPIGNQR